MTASTLGRWLSGQGFQVNDNAVLGRTATWNRVRFIMVHHTAGNEASSAESGGASYVRRAPDSKFPPLYHIYLGQSGRVWMVARQRSGQNEPGRATHAGRGIWNPGPIRRDEGNIVSLAIGVQCNGSHALRTHASQYRVLIRLIAALCRRYNLNEKQVLGHKEYSSEGKIDPRDNMNTLRADVRTELRSGSDNPTVRLSRLRKGLANGDVKRLKRRLNKLNDAGLNSTNRYGGATDKAVRRDQRRNGFAPANQPEGSDRVGPRQAERLWRGTKVRVIDDR